ncbi:MAG: dynamin family protein, partial [Vicinamibacteria bacterium]
MLGSVLSPAHEELLARERDRLGALRDALGSFGAAEEDRKALEGSIRQLDELFLLVIVGEFNAGKSAFINALLGDRLVAEGVTPTTSRIQLLMHGAAIEKETTEEDGVLVVRAPIELLREINIVDTPGTNAIQREHEALTRKFLPRSDLVLFVTSADRPFTESERQFL